MTEMVCVSPDGRITPGCAGMYAPQHEAAWRRITGFVHEYTSAGIGLQLGHSGRKGSTKLMWEGIDEPLDEGNWPGLRAVADPLPGRGQPGTARADRRRAGDRSRTQFVAATLAAERAGFDLIELHCAHGYLLSSFISPVTNQRTDAYGGSLAARLRYPLEVFEAMRAVWPAGQADDGADLGDRLGAWRHHRRRRRADRRGVRGRGRRRHRRVDRPGHPR